MRSKTSILLILAAFASLAIHSAVATDIELGDDKDTVLSILGKPRGQIKKGKSEYWSYMRGIVRITDDKVTYVNLDSPAEARKKEADRRAALKAIAETERKAAEERSLKIQEGTKLKASKLNDEEFLALPLDKQLEFWTGFKRQYSMIDISSVIEPLKSSIAQENEPEEKSEREILLETIESKQAELDEWIQKAKTTSAGRTWRRKYHLARNKLEEDLETLRAELKTLPAE